MGRVLCSRIVGIGRVLLPTKVSTTSGLFEISSALPIMTSGLNSHFHFLLQRLSSSEYTLLPLSSFNTQDLNLATLVLISVQFLILTRVFLEAWPS